MWCLVLAFFQQPAPAELPRIVVVQDDTVIDRSCRISIPKGTVIRDAAGDGVIQIATAGVVVEFEPGSVLRGADAGLDPDRFEGVGIRAEGVSGVVLRGLRVQGFKLGVEAVRCDGLLIEDADVSANFRQRLGSTPLAEDGADWLWPHENDGGEWRARYGAAIDVRDSRAVTVRRCRVREGQNGIMLERVEDSRIYDNDCSFLSGWGLALWRSSRNTISRNAFDFCVRGYSHGVYNRGQDSAGILCFEQCSGNVIVENSVTHGGDGFFGFAGREALADTGEHPADWYRRRGNNDNLLAGNDFSYAPAHGIEMTFSFGNVFARNRLVGNAICGVWGGYSQDTRILENEFAANGEMGYGLERGGVNVEHGRGILVAGNRFRGNACGVHFWWDPEGDFLERPWGAANGSASRDNLVLDNRFEDEAVGLQLRGDAHAVLARNSWSGAGARSALEAESELVTSIPAAEIRAEVPAWEALGERRPVGARASLAGREQIVMTAWGPWDHESPLLRRIADHGGRQVWEVRGVGAELEVRLESGRQVEVDSEYAGAEDRHLVAFTTAASGVRAYRASLSAEGFDAVVHGALLAMEWELRVFRWTIDPLVDLDGWRTESRNAAAFVVNVPQLRFPFGGRGPSAIAIDPVLTAASFGDDRFGMVARTRVRLPAGRWRVVTTSDDGIRVFVDQEMLIERWDIHGPTRDAAEFELSREKLVELRLEYFENNGHAVLEAALERVPDSD
ncbi:MAG TPA: right-handed parallel beta-helix repeat-containing protein [Planctomycetota bacterium]